MTCAAAAFAATPILPGVETHHPVLSPDGTQLLYSTPDHTGLSILNLADGSVRVLDTDAGAGFNPVFSMDGNTVFYRTAELQDGLMYRDVRSYDLKGGKATRVQAPSRRDVNLVALADSRYAVADYHNIIVSDGEGKTAAISPLANAHSYLWASLNPKADRILFTEPFEGVYVSDLDGTNARRLLRKGDYPAWVNDRWIVAVHTRDDGYQVTQARLVAVDSYTGNHIDLTDDTVKVAEATAANGRVVYTTIEGDTFIITPEFEQ